MWPRFVLFHCMRIIPQRCVLLLDMFILINDEHVPIQWFVWVVMNVITYINLLPILVTFVLDSALSVVIT
jgi:hypothetical protein